MRLLINTASAMQGGSVQVAYSFINECLNIQGHQYGVIVAPSLQKLIAGRDLGPAMKVFPVSERPSQSPIRAFAGNVFNDIEQEFKPDVVFTTSGPAYWKSRAPHLIGYNLPHYIYPESPVFRKCGIKENIHWKVWKYLIRYFYNRDADALVVQTDDVNKRVRDLLKCQDVTTVYNTCGRQFFEPASVEQKRFTREPGKKYLLYLTTYYSHKNIEIINRVVPALEKAEPGKYVFVLTLPADKFSACIHEDVQRNVVNVGPVPPEACPGLYLQADYTFLPSLLECFSASYAESMAMGRPILTSDMGFARTVCADAAVYFDPVDSKAIADAILSLDAAPDRVQALISAGSQRLKGFNDAHERALAYLSLCERLAAQRAY